MNESCEKYMTSSRTNCSVYLHVGSGVWGGGPERKRKEVLLRDKVLVGKHQVRKFCVGFKVMRGARRDSLAPRRGLMGGAA